MFVHALMGAEADALCGAGYGQRSDERVNVRNGYWHRDFAPPRTASRAVPPPASAPSTWPSRSCGRDRTSPTGCSNAASGPNVP
ncbi:transposase [Rhodococcus aetherivorans]